MPPVAYHYDKFPPRNLDWTSLVSLIEPATRKNDFLVEHKSLGNKFAVHETHLTLHKYIYGAFVHNKLIRRTQSYFA